MAVAKINLNGNTLIDLTNDTVAANNLATGETAHGADGEPVVGEVSIGNWTTDGIATNIEPNGTIILGSSVTTIADYAFYNKPITAIYGSEVTSVKGNALTGTKITSITDDNFPKLGVTTNFQILLRLPSTCTLIKLSGSNIDLSNGSAALRYSSGLVRAEFPHAKTNGTGNFAFAGLTNLELVDLGNANLANGNIFNGSSKLRTLILRRTSSVQSLSSWSANMMGGIYNNPTLSTIYVPDALISDYQTASNWSSAYAAGVTFAKIEGSEYE